MSQNKFMLPVSGEIWRHYKGTIYTVVGLSRDPNGKVEVIYTPYPWSLAQMPPLYNQPIGRWLEEIAHNIPRFENSGRHCDNCRYIRAEPGPTTTTQDDGHWR